MLPTVRRFSLSTLYAFANLRDVMVQLMAQPRSDVSLGVDVHVLALADRDDGYLHGERRSVLNVRRCSSQRLVELPSGLDVVPGRGGQFGGTGIGVDQSPEPCFGTRELREIDRWRP